jgi:integrase
MADAILSTLRGMANWFAARDDNYNAPFVRNMRRTPAQDRRRDRTLTDAEIRQIWKAAAANGQYGAIVQLLLLTAQRYKKVATLCWSDVDEHTGIWTLRTEAREKQNPGRLKLPQAALDIYPRAATDRQQSIRFLVSYEQRLHEDRVRFPMRRHRLAPARSAPHGKIVDGTRWCVE